jgi:hypothetical protein
MGGIRAVFLSLLVVFSSSTSLWAATASNPRNAPAFEALSLKSIAGWLKRDGREGWLGADVADAVGIPRLATEDLLEARQRGFRDDDALRVVQLSADERRDFLLFMVQRSDGQVYFYLASVREGLKGAFVSVPSSGRVSRLESAEAQALFQRELRFWEGRVAVR